MDYSASIENSEILIYVICESGRNCKINSFAAELISCKNVYYFFCKRKSGWVGSLKKY